MRKRYGLGNWHKRKGIAKVRPAPGMVLMAKVHGYEAARIGKREFKIKHYLE